MNKGQNRGQNVVELEISKDFNWTKRLRDHRVNPDKFLVKSGFFKQLHRETLRAQRSKSALSILILTVENGTEDKSINIDEVSDLVRKNTRDTDFIGFIDPKTVGVILPYTNEKGAKDARRKLVNGNNSRLFSTSTFTYPDKIFESLEESGCIQQNAFPFEHDESMAVLWFKLRIKRIFDIAGSIFCLVALMPIMLMAALAIKVTSPGPIIFKQIRLGKNGVPFTFYKFRSMHVNTDDEIHRKYVFELIVGNHEKINNGDAGKPLYKIKSDPRVTRVGKILRKTSIDELPQLVNALNGDMSLVGPRPPLPYEAQKYQPWHLRRILEMKPGITGLWQVEGRGTTSWDDSVRLDIRYIEKWSLGYDLKILCRTIKEVLACRGAV